MSLSFSTVLGDRHAKGVLLVGLLLFSLLASLKHLVLDWVKPSTDTDALARPNILLIVADDLGYNDTSAFSSTGLATPNLERLAREGVSFHRHYADATCTPSRVAILTGRYPERSGFRPVGSEIPAEFATIAEQLKSAGYATYLTGKWHAGEERAAAWPQNKGFDGWFGFLNQWELSGEVTDADKGRSRPTYYNPALRLDGGELAQYDGHLTDILIEHSLEKLEQLQQSDQPWFLYHAFLAPHQPLQPHERFARQHPDTPEGKYTALVEQLDDAVGRLLDAIDRDKTLVVFVSDNGGTNTERDNNFPFHGKKGEMYEGAFRTPLIISWPGSIPEGKRVDQVAMNVDIFPTLLAAAHISAPTDLDGTNLWPALLHDMPLGGRARSWEVYSANVNTLSYSFLARDGDWRLSNPQGLAHSLYDMVADPSGGQDVSAGSPGRVSALSSEYWEEHWRKSVVPVVGHRDNGESRTRYTGFDAMRTPNRHGFAIGLEIGPFPGELTRTVTTDGALLAGQEGVWALRYIPDHGVEWQLGDIRLKDTRFNPSRCNAIVLTGYFEPRGHLAKREPRSEIKLYSSGVLADALRDVAFSPQTDAALESPTFVDFGGRAIFANIMLSSFADNYAPRLKPQFMEYYTAAFRERRLSLADVSMLDSRLCQ